MITNKSLQEDLHQAIRNNDVRRKTALRLLISSIKFAELSNGTALPPTEILRIIQKEIKTKQDTIHDAKQANREDLISEAEVEIDILNEYLPKQLSYDEVLRLAGEIIAELNASSMQDMGRVIKVLIERLNGQATNQDASKAVRELLQN